MATLNKLYYYFINNGLFQLPALKIHFATCMKYVKQNVSALLCSP